MRISLYISRSIIQNQALGAAPKTACQHRCKRQINDLRYKNCRPR